MTSEQELWSEIYRLRHENIELKANIRALVSKWVEASKIKEKVV